MKFTVLSMFAILVFSGSASAATQVISCLDFTKQVTMKINGEDLKVLETSLTPHADAAALTCSGDTIYLVKVQVPGGKPITGRQWQLNNMPQ